MSSSSHGATRALWPTNIGIRCTLTAAGSMAIGSAMSWAQPELMHYYITEQGMNEAKAGFIITAEMCAMSLGAMLLAPFIKRHHAHWFAVIGIVLCLLFSWFSLKVDNFQTLVASRIFVGLSLSATFIITNIIAANAPDPDRLYGQINSVNLMFGSALIFMVPFLTNLVGLANPYAGLAIVIGLVYPIMFLLPRFQDFDLIGHSAYTDQCPHRRNENFTSTILLALVTFFAALSSGIMWSFYAIIGAGTGLSEDEVFQAISLAPLVALLGAILPAVIGNRFGRIIPVALALVVLVLAILALCNDPTATTFRIAIGLNIGAMYFIWPYLSGSGAAIDGGGKAATTISATFILANSVAPFSGGVIVTSIGISSVGFVLLVISPLLFIGFLLVQKRIQGKPSHHQTVAVTDKPL